jgi:HK97 family phage prohead protease
MADENQPSETEREIQSPLLDVETRSATRIADTDFPQRIVTVVAMPYEQATRVPYRGEMWNELFTRGAFQGFDAKRRRVPVSAALRVPDLNHADGQLVGKIVEAYHDREEGLVTDIQIARTQQGEDTLQLAKDGMLGASVGFGIKSKFDQQLDRATKTRRVHRAFLHHLSFVGEPAYEGAVVTGMRSGTSIETPGSATPIMDEFLEDEFFRQMLNRVNR